MKRHTVIGERLCGELRSLETVRQIVRHHHERRNGSGYPDGLRGDDIPLLAQIIGIVDTYDAITTTRPYRAALPAEYVYEELTRETTMGLHREDLVDAFIQLGRAGSLDSIAAAVSARTLSGTLQSSTATATFRSRAVFHEGLCGPVGLSERLWTRT